MKTDAIKFFELISNTWRQTTSNTLKAGHKYIKLYDLTASGMQFKGIGIYKTSTS
mgnify:CR=1 FL=1